MSKPHLNRARRTGRLHNEGAGGVDTPAAAERQVAAGHERRLASSIYVETIKVSLRPDRGVTVTPYTRARRACKTRHTCSAVSRLLASHRIPSEHPAALYGQSAVGTPHTQPFNDGLRSPAITAEVRSNLPQHHPNSASSQMHRH